MLKIFSEDRNKENANFNCGITNITGGKGFDIIPVATIEIQVKYSTYYTSIARPDRLDQLPSWFWQEIPRCISKRAKKSWARYSACFIDQ